MSKDRKSTFVDYLKKVKAANKELTKKELFKELLHRLYSEETEIQKTIDVIAPAPNFLFLIFHAKQSIHVQKR